MINMNLNFYVVELELISWLTIRGHKFRVSFLWMYSRLGIPWSTGKARQGDHLPCIQQSCFTRKWYISKAIVLVAMMMGGRGGYATSYFCKARRPTNCPGQNMSQGWLWRVCSTSQSWWGQVQKHHESEIMRTSCKNLTQSHYKTMTKSGVKLGAASWLRM